MAMRYLVHLVKQENSTFQWLLNRSARNDLLAAQQSTNLHKFSGSRAAIEDALSHHGLVFSILDFLGLTRTQPTESIIVETA